MLYSMLLPSYQILCFRERERLSGNTVAFEDAIVRESAKPRLVPRPKSLDQNFYSSVSRSPRPR